MLYKVAPLCMVNTFTSYVTGPWLEARRSHMLGGHILVYS